LTLQVELTSSTAVTKRNNLVTQGTKRGISNGSSFFFTTVEGKCPGKHNYSGRKCTRGKEMSRKTPKIQEKVHQQRGNVPEIATKRGGTISAEKNVQETATKPGKGCKISPFKWYICKR
jgi:hypothetical protein